MPFHLRRISDRRSWSGLRSEAIAWDEESEVGKIHGHEPEIGKSILVGPIRSNDIWITTQVEEILEEIRTEQVDYIRFRTKNSEYEWWNGVHPKERDED
jgi:hypothetical protein